MNERRKKQLCCGKGRMASKLHMNEIDFISEGKLFNLLQLLLSNVVFF
jgi:hypothetical protein